MSARETLAEMRAIEQAATEGPWEAGGGDDDPRPAVWAARSSDCFPRIGDPWGSPPTPPPTPPCTPRAHTTTETPMTDRIDHATARTALPKALAALEAVLALHRRVGIYDDCECDDKNTPEHEDIYEIGVTCNKVYEICAACCRDDVYQSEECVNYHQHDTGEHYCPSGTVVAIAEALGIEP